MKITPKITVERIKSSLKEGKRFDGRKPEEFRELVIEKNVSKKAEGSVRVKLGKTEVIVGVKMDVVTPYSDGPDEGVFMTTAEMLPASSERYEPGPPKIEAIELARIIDRGIRESGFIDFKKLCIVEGEKVWQIFVDIYSINDDGNLLDASGIGALAALKVAKIPKYDKENEKVLYGEWTKDNLPLVDEKMPLNITIHKIGNSLTVDPVREEEDSSEARLSIAIADFNGNPKITSMQKGNETSISIEELGKMLDIAEVKWKEIKKKFDILTQGNK
jgi:exosome complex component RRP42